MATTEKESSSKESVVQKIDEGNIKMEENKEIHENDSTEEATCIKNYKAKEDNQCEDCEMFYDAMEYNSCQSENKTERFSDSSQKNSPSEHQTDSSEVIRDAQEQNEPAEEKTEEDEIEKEIESQEDLTPQQKEERKIEAKKYKDQGNECFRKCEYPEAKELYTRSIRICPNEFKEEKAVFYANRAACLVKMDLQKDAIEDCTKALDLNDKYLKARLRRAQCYEHVEKLEEALEDYQKVFEQDNSSHVAREALMRLPEEIKIKHEKMKEEMIGKLKDLGNVFLKPFGLSTNNFKLQQDPSSGGYTINFQK